MPLGILLDLTLVLLEAGNQFLERGTVGVLPGALVECCRRTPYPVPWLSVFLLITTVDAAVDTAVDTAASIAFSNAVRAERSEDRHRVTPTGVLRQHATADLDDTNVGWM